MAMKISILFLLVATNLLVAVKCDPDPFFPELASSGIRVKIPTEMYQGLVSVSVSVGQLQVPFNEVNPFQWFSGPAFIQTDGSYVYENPNIPIGPYGIAYIAVALQTENDGQQSVQVKGKVWEVPPYATPVP